MSDETIVNELQGQEMTDDSMSNDETTDDSIDDAIITTEDESLEDVIVVTPAYVAPLYTLYIPDFVEAYKLSSTSLAKQKTELSPKDWLTPGLIEEIEVAFPTCTEINPAEDIEHDSTVFQQKIAKLFPSGRMFASFKQLDQAAAMLLGAWAVKKTLTSKSIRCWYGRTSNKKPRVHSDPSKRRKVQPTLKNVYNCPFFMRYSYVGYPNNKALKKPDIFYHVKITSVNFLHTCQMTTIFHRQALQKSGGLQPDLNGLNDIMSLLREKPMLQSEVLRPLLTKYLPFYKATDSMFLVNFRIRAAHWLIENGSKDLTMEEARHISSKSPMASQEFLLTDDPMQKQNLTSLLRKVMQEDSSTWDALRFLDEMKGTNPGFDYRIKYDPFG